MELVCELPGAGLPGLQPRYLVFLPAGSEAGAGASWLLLLSLHGSGERGDDLGLVKLHGIPTQTPATIRGPAPMLSRSCTSGCSRSGAVDPRAHPRHIERLDDSAGAGEAGCLRSRLREAHSDVRVARLKLARPSWACRSFGGEALLSRRWRRESPPRLRRGSRGRLGGRPRGARPWEGGPRPG